MNTLLDYFGAVYLINLPERKDRFKSAAAELARVGWRFGSDAVQLYSARKFTDRAGFPGSASVRGCFHSHLDCIRTTHLLRKSSVLIMEDDIALASSIQLLTPSIISQLESAPWDFFYLGHEHTGKIGKANARTGSVKLILTTAEILTAHFFAINSRIFETLLEHLDRVASGAEGDQEFGPMPIDGAYNVFRRKNHGIRTLIADPKLGWQRPSRSDLSPRSIDRFNSLRPVIGAMRNIKYAISRWRS